MKKMKMEFSRGANLRISDAPAELPDDLRNIIRLDTEEGLTGFRSRDFDGEVKRRLEREGEQRQRGRRRLVFLRRAPAFGLAVAALVIGAAVLWLGRGGMQAPAGDSIDAGFLMATLQDAPGMVNLGEYQLPSSSGAAPGWAVSLPFSDLLSTREAAPASREVPPAIPPAIRTTLEHKMQLLYADRVVERALAPFEDKFKED